MNSGQFITHKTNLTIIYYGIYMVRIGTHSLFLGGGADITLSKMREGRENLYPSFFGQSSPYLSQNCKKSILAQKSYGSWFYDIPYHTNCKYLEAEDHSEFFMHLSHSILAHWKCKNTLDFFVIVLWKTNIRFISDKDISMAWMHRCF